MKYLILLEGSTEQAFIEVLMDKGMLAINEDDMLDMRPHQKRQVDSYLAALIRQLDPDDSVRIMKIGDKMTDRLRIPKDIAGKIESQRKYCTKPEFEMLLILAEELTSEFEKVKSKMKPKAFAKANIVYNQKRYANSPDWIRSYFEPWSRAELVRLLNVYKRYKRHAQGELYLIQLIRS